MAQMVLSNGNATFGLSAAGGFGPDIDNASPLGSAALRLSNVFGLIHTVQGANGESLALKYISEEITLATGGLTTDSTADLLPANSFILQVTSVPTVTIVTATGYKLGDATTTGRFLANTTSITAGLGSIGIVHLQGGISTDAAGPIQVAAAKLRITAAGSNPSAGKVRVTVFYLQAVAPTS